MVRTIEVLLRQAETNAKHQDGKTYCEMDEIRLLLEEGARAVAMNSPQIGEAFYHLVEYEGRLFETVTKGSEEGLPNTERPAVFRPYHGDIGYDYSGDVYDTFGDYW